MGEEMNIETIVFLIILSLIIFGVIFLIHGWKKEEASISGWEYLQKMKPNKR